MYNNKFNRHQRRRLMSLQHRAIQYFLDNQLSSGLVLDRQVNQGRRIYNRLTSTSATGMGLMAHALACMPEYRLISGREAVERVQRALNHALNMLPHKAGIMPHFGTAEGGTIIGADKLATIDASWLIAGGMVAAELLKDSELQMKAQRLYDRVDWRYWSLAVRYGDLAAQPGDLTPKLQSRATGHWLLHGMRQNDTFMPAHWDRLNAETAFMYLLATGAQDGLNLPVQVWRQLEKAANQKGVISADLGLFVHQYSLELIDFAQVKVPGGFDLLEECRKGVVANRRKCLSLANRFRTYGALWGLSAGDGPGDNSLQPDAYRPYGPEEPPTIDGTAHVTATLASIGVCADLVLANIDSAWRLPGALGRYGFSNINLDCNWVSQDVVGIDLGAAVIALDNVLHGDRIKKAFCALEPVRRALRLFEVLP